jgi:hypothetical protein
VSADDGLPLKNAINWIKIIANVFLKMKQYMGAFKSFINALFKPYSAFKSFKKALLTLNFKED